MGMTTDSLYGTPTTTATELIETSSLDTLFPRYDGDSWGEDINLGATTKMSENSGSNVFYQVMRDKLEILRTITPIYHGNPENLHYIVNNIYKGLTENVLA